MNAPTIPPRFVPTLTDVVQSSVAQAPPAVRKGDARTQLEDQMVHGVMQRVDLVLERRLREAMGQVILTHTQALGPLLREEIERVVRESVSHAVETELSTQAVPD